MQDPLNWAIFQIKSVSPFTFVAKYEIMFDILAVVEFGKSALSHS